MDKETISSYIKTIVNSDLQNSDISISGTSEQGDGFTGDILFLETRHKGKLLSFAVKLAKKDLKEVAPGLVAAYKNEEYIYSKVFPTMESKFGSNIPSAKFYGTFDEGNVLILENLKPRGFQLNDFKNKMNINHIKLVLEAYAQWHAYSFIFRAQDPEGFQKLAEPLKETLTDVLERGLLKGFERNFNKTYSDLIESGEECLAEKFKNVSLTHLLDLFKMTEEQSVIVHGDCWNNNYMFKSSEGCSSEVVILDWQLSHLASPVLDLSYFLLNNLDLDGLNRFDELLELYYSTLCEICEKHGVDPKSVFSREDFDKHWQKYGVCGLLFAPSTYRLSVVDRKDIPNLADTIKGSNVNRKEINISDKFVCLLRVLDSKKLI